MKLNLRCELDRDGQWLADVVQMPGFLAYGITPERALAAVQGLVLRQLADQVEKQDTPIEVQFHISNDKLSQRPLVDEPDPEDAEAYAAWMKVGLQEAIDDDGPAIPHDEAMRRIRLSLKLS